MKTIPLEVKYDETRTGWINVPNSWKQEMSSLTLEVLEAYRLGYEAGKAAQGSSTNSNEPDVEFYFDVYGDGCCTFLGAYYGWYEQVGTWIAYADLTDFYAPYTRVSAEAFYERFPEALNVRPSENVG